MTGCQRCLCVLIMILGQIPLCAACSTLCFIVHCFQHIVLCCGVVDWEYVSMKESSRKAIHIILRVLFVIYLVMMVYFLFFSERFGRVPSNNYHYNLKPFAEINRYLSYIDTIGVTNVLINLMGNVVCFMPLGFMLPVLSQRKWKLIRTTLLSCLASVIVELTQLVSKLGSCDVDDVLMNTLGGLLGYILFVICSKIYSQWKKAWEKKD